MSAVTAWSYSRLELYERCPLAFKLKHIDKTPEAQSPAMERGDRIHKEIAAYLQKKVDRPPQEASKYFSKLMKELHDLPPDWTFFEQQWGFTQNWQATGWFGKDTWFRAVLDAGAIYPDNTADAVDHKTGKKYAVNAEQMEVFGLAVLCRFPHVEKVTTRLWYHDSGDEVVDEVTVDERSALIAKWDARVAPMFADTAFIARPNEKCRWCAFSKSAGGVCKFG
jgi:hypothetical protein